MTKLLLTWLAIYTVIILAACKKDKTEPASLASFVIVNAINNGAPVKADFTGKDSVFTTTIPETEYNRSKKYTIPAGLLVPIKVVSSANTDEVLFNKSMTFQPGDIYTLFLAGEPGTVDTILVKDNPVVPAANQMTIRFINCSTSGTIKIVPNLVDANGVTTPQAEIPGLAYRQMTDFIPYFVDGTVNYYLIEFRNSVTDEILGTTIIQPFTSNWTVAIRGYIGGSPALGALRMRQDL